MSTAAFLSSVSTSRRPQNLEAVSGTHKTNVSIIQFLFTVLSDIPYIQTWCFNQKPTKEHLSVSDMKEKLVVWHTEQWCGNLHHGIFFEG